jgi:plasmid maintenance system killer protein
MEVRVVRSLSKTLSSGKAMQVKYGQLAKPLQIRISKLRSVSSLAAVPRDKPERCHQLSEDRHEQFAVDIKGKWRLVFVVDHDVTPRRPDGGVDLAAVTAICITEISDHYQ